ncbi:MAG: hypothetical protein ABIA93_07410 [Candidatus Woesearchaeota archaeon]
MSAEVLIGDIYVDETYYRIGSPTSTIRFKRTSIPGRALCELMDSEETPIAIQALVKRLEVNNLSKALQGLSDEVNASSSVYNLVRNYEQNTWVLRRR